MPADKGKQTTAFRRLRTITLVVVFLLVVAGLLWRSAHRLGQRKLQSFIANLPMADVLVIEGAFVDRDDKSRKTIRVRLTDRADIEDIAACFSAARPTVVYSNSLFLSLGARTLDAVYGSLSIERGDEVTTLDFLGTDGFVPNRFTYVELNGFSANEVYARLKERGLFSETSDD